MRSARLIAWLGLVLAAALSLLPARWVWRPPLPQHVDHALAYFVLGGVLALAQRSLGTRALSLAGLIAAAALLECGQLFLRSRHASLADFLASAAGAAAGIVLGSAAARLAAAVSMRLRSPGRLRRAEAPETGTPRPDAGRPQDWGVRPRARATIQARP